MKLERVRGAWAGVGLGLLNLIALLAILNVASALTLAVLSRRAPATLAERNARVSWYQSRPWAPAFWREFSAVRGVRYEPFVLWRQVPRRGTYLGIGDDGLRVTPGAQCRAGAFRVFVFGGSAAWGWGAPDSSTIPALLQTELASRHTPLCVVNYGQPGWVSTQEVIELERQLQRGHIPALAIFYDGYNDALHSRINRTPAAHYSLDHFADRLTTARRVPPLAQLLHGTAAWRLASRLRRGAPAGGDAPPLPPDSAERLAAATADQYHANVKIVAALASAFGFEYAFFWQPMLGTGSRRPTPEERAYAPVLDPPFFRAVDRRVRAAAGDGHHWYYLGDALDAQDSTVFIDHVHVTPDGNAIVAKHIAGLLDQR